MVHLVDSEEFFYVYDNYCYLILIIYTYLPTPTLGQHMTQGHSLSEV